MSRSDAVIAGAPAYSCGFGRSRHGKGVPYMSGIQKKESPVFRLDVNGAVVTVRFSDTETEDVKARVRDILTESYEERFQRTVQECAQLV